VLQHLLLNINQLDALNSLQNLVHQVGWY